MEVIGIMYNKRCGNCKKYAKVNIIDTGKDFDYIKRCDNCKPAELKEVKK